MTFHFCSFNKLSRYVSDKVISIVDYTLKSDRIRRLHNYFKFLCSVASIIHRGNFVILRTRET